MDEKFSSEYVLREKDEKELRRLKFQHEVWQAETNLAIKKTKLNPGGRVIDLGSGPGYLGMELAEIVKEEGTIFCLDSSATFVEYIQAQNHPRIVAMNLDIRDEVASYFDRLTYIDVIFCRWVLMFTGKAEKIVGDAFHMLKPGGRFISMEYFNFRHISMFPQRDSFDKIYAAVWNLLHSGGGDPDIGGKMAGIMQSVGFRHVDVFPIYKTGNSRSDLWKWLDQTNVNHRNLVDANLISEEDLQAFYDDWEALSQDEIAFITAPPLMITVGEK